jgi:hypothetical protein
MLLKHTKILSDLITYNDLDWWLSRVNARRVICGAPQCCWIGMVLAHADVSLQFDAAYYLHCLFNTGSVFDHTELF